MGFNNLRLRSNPNRKVILEIDSITASKNLATKKTITIKYKYITQLKASKTNGNVVLEIHSPGTKISNQCVGFSK